MPRFTTGNLLEAKAEALVNTVNTVDVMGKGIALMFSEAFPAVARAYKQACKRGEVQVGRMLVTPTDELTGPRWVIHFPTKKDWRQQSRLEWVRDGLADLVRVIRANHIHSIAIPPLGCGNGGLAWPQVRREIERSVGDLDGVEVVVYEPVAAYQNRPKGAGVDVLTPARALIAELVRRYAMVGLPCALIEVQKLAWFLHRAIEALGLPDPLALRFKANRYGPYSDRLRHLLASLDGSYLHCDRRLGDAGPYDEVWFERSRREVVDAYIRSDAAGYVPALERASSRIDGFESPLGLEVLATIDWLLSQLGAEPSLAGVRAGLARWPGGREAGRRKQRLFEDRMIEFALDRLGAVPQSSAPAGSAPAARPTA